LIAADADSETIMLPPDLGTLICPSRSPLIHLHVEYAGAVLGSREIGSCQIHRNDQRSSHIWSYMLSKDEEPADCGIELRVIENLPIAGSPMQASMAQAGPMASMSVRPGAQPNMPAQIPVQEHGVVAFLELDKVTDLPYPPTETMDKIFITILDGEKELQRVGPFNARNQTGGFQHKTDTTPPDNATRLVMADCVGSSTTVKTVLNVGGDAKEGTMSISIGVSYKKGRGLDLVGVTDPIPVTFVPSQNKFYEIKQKQNGSVLGGVRLSQHRLMTEAEAQNPAAPGTGGPIRPELLPPIEPIHRVSGRTGNFPPGSPEEAFEQAAINAEAQNRAYLQLCRIADPKDKDTSGRVRTINGYREWDSLDGVFATMGPNPLAMSEEVGPSVTRGYQETTSIIKEVAPRMGPPRCPADEAVNVQLLGMLYKKDPYKVDTVLRPVVCKNPHEIAGPRDMRWCPDPPVYVPLRNIREEDKETIRLACYDPSQDAKITFADANPNYRLSEDIWGIQADYKTAASLYVPKPAYHRTRRVKDDCLMA